MSILKNNRGMTLLEVLASVLIIGLIIVAVSYLFTTGYANSIKEQDKDVSVQIARAVLEEIKHNLKTTRESASYQSQIIDLNPLRVSINTGETVLPALYYPSQADKQYTILVKNMGYEDRTYQFKGSNDKNYSFSVKPFFSLIEVEVKREATSTMYKLQSYMEKN
jgi:prepilin-type N-terminal cleavage/methylation domain-containing protein